MAGKPSTVPAIGNRVSNRDNPLPLHVAHCAGGVGSFVFVAYCRSQGFRPSAVWNRRL